MGRTVEGYTTRNARRYVPEAYDNRSDPDPIVVMIRYPTEHDRRTMHRPESEGVEMKKVDGEDTMRLKPISEASLFDRAIRACLVSCSNYFDRNHEPIDDAESFITHAETDLYYEVATEILDSASYFDRDAEKAAEQKKTSDASSSSAQAVTSQPDGIAGNAKNKGSTLSDDATEDPIETIGHSATSSPTGLRNSTDAQRHGLETRSAAT